MDEVKFQEELNDRINKYDLLQHSFYKAWSMGYLTKLDLLDYAQNYYHHVAAYPQCLDNLLSRVPAGSTREIIEQNKSDEEGAGYSDGRPHGELWLDFVEGMGGRRDFAQKHKPLAEFKSLISDFDGSTRNDSVVEALSILYAYESQVPRLAAEKSARLKEEYDADDKACIYFDTHVEEDTEHSRTLLEELTRNVTGSAERCKAALDAAERGAKWLWQALDGIERIRQQNLLVPAGAD
ncbi:MAG TPA: iron-containing redox enzyme family protein [Chroococcales cyanobacterium]